MGRAPCCDKANVKRGPWSPEEDAKLKSYIDTNGTGGNWIALPQKIGLKRCGKSCRLRWLNYLRPNIKHGSFSEEEDNIICTLYLNIGSRWSIIAAQLPGRTDNDIKNYWNTKLKKKLLGKQRKGQQVRRASDHMIKQEMKRENVSFNTISSMNLNPITYNFQYPFGVPSSQPQPLDQNSNFTSTTTPYVVNDEDIVNFQELNNWTIDQLNELLYNGTTQNIDQYDDGYGTTFSGVDMVNGSSGTTNSTESTSWASTDHMSCSFVSPYPALPPVMVTGNYENSPGGFVQDSRSLIEESRYFGF